MKRILIIIIVLLFVFSIAAQSKFELTIDKAITMAIENSYQHLISKEGVKLSQKRLLKNMGFLPTLSLQGQKNLDEKLMEIEIPSFIPGGEPTKTSLDFTMDYEFSFQIVQPIFTGGKIWHAFKNAQIDVKIAREQEKNSRAQVVLDTKKVFYNILVMKELLKAHRGSLALAEKNFKNVKEKFELGMVSKYDLLRSQLSVATLKPIIANVEKLDKILKLNLKTMLKIPEETELLIKGKLDYDPQQIDTSKLIKDALSRRSEIQQLKMQSTKTKNLLKMAYAQFFPDFSIIAQYSYRSNYFKFTEDNWEDYYTINLGISFPIFSGLKRSGQIGELKVARRILDLSLQQLNDATKVQVENLCLTVEQEYENIQAGLLNIETAREGVRIAELNYNEGIISILELNASINELTRAQVSFLQAVYNYKIALAQMEKITSLNISGGQL